MGDAVSYILASSSGSVEVEENYDRPPAHVARKKAGGWVEGGMADEFIAEATHVVQQHMNASDFRVLSAWSQVVRGINVHLNVVAFSKQMAVLANLPPFFSDSVGLPQFRIVKI